LDAGDERQFPRLELMRGKYPDISVAVFSDWTQRNSREVIADLRLVLESVRLCHDQ